MFETCFLLDMFGLEQYCKHVAIVVHFPSCLLPVFMSLVFRSALMLL